MPLISCPECKKDVSTEADSCPHCGHPIKQKSQENQQSQTGQTTAKKKSMNPLLLIILVIVGFSIIYAIGNAIFDNGGSSSYNRPGINHNWQYSESTDQLTQKKIKIASAISKNTVNFQFPYDGTQRASLNVRSHPKWGREIYISLNKAHFLCSFRGCNVSVRFDDKAPQRYYAVEPADHSTNTLFIKGFNKFVANAKKSKKIMIETQFYKEGSRVFKFNPSSLKW